jgi:hypothetical protein
MSNASVQQRFRSVWLAVAACATVGAASAQQIQGPPPGPGKAAASAAKVSQGVSQFKIASTSDWTSTGLTVRRGETIRVKAWGRARLQGTQLADPDGLDIARVAKFLPDAPVGHVIAVIGDDNNDYITVGKEAEFTAKRDGVLYLGINQLDPSMNTGDFDVRVTIGNASGLAFGRFDATTAPPAVFGDPPAAKTSSPDEKSIAVMPRLEWTNTYLQVNVGDTVVVEASGSVDLDLAGHATGPGGTTLKDPNRLMPDKPTGALVAVVGVDNNDFIFVGAKGQFVSARTGLLFLGINEEDLTNNAGSFDAHVRVLRAPKQD